MNVAMNDECASLNIPKFMFNVIISDCTAVIVYDVSSAFVWVCTLIMFIYAIYEKYCYYYADTTTTYQQQQENIEPFLIFILGGFLGFLGFLAVGIISLFCFALLVNFLCSKKHHSYQ
jgi:hypothetical protein